MAVTESPATTETRTEKGVSLSRGPALILGTILLIAGLYFLYKQHTFTKLSNFPNGDAPVQTKVLGIFGVNGWSGELTAAAGGLLLFGAAQHLLAKTMSLIVAIVLGAAAIIALISNNVLGLAAANHWTELGWGIAAVILFFNTLVPRRRREVVVDRPVADERPVARDRPVADERAVRGTPSTETGGVGAAAAGAGLAGGHNENATAVQDRRDQEATTVNRRDAQPPAE